MLKSFSSIIPPNNSNISGLLLKQMASYVGYCNGIDLDLCPLISHLKSAFS